MSTYRNAKRDAAIADDYLANHLPCRFCNVQTPTDDLERFGARCGQCYQAYLAEANPRWWPNRQLTHDERAAVIRKARKVLAQFGQQQGDPRQWASALQSRENAGERLTIVQKRFWREALRTHLLPVGDAA